MDLIERESLECVLVNYEGFGVVCHGVLLSLLLAFELTLSISAVGESDDLSVSRVLFHKESFFLELPVIVSHPDRSRAASCIKLGKASFFDIVAES